MGNIVFVQYIHRYWILTIFDIKSAQIKIIDAPC
jgi:hypothetical protein